MFCMTRYESLIAISLLRFAKEFSHLQIFGECSNGAVFFLRLVARLLMPSALVQSPGVPSPRAPRSSARRALGCVLQQSSVLPRRVVLVLPAKELRHVKSEN